MSDPRPLNSLARSLREAMHLTSGARDAGWVRPGAPMHQALKEVSKVFGGHDDSTRPARDDMLVAVGKFLRQPRVESFTQLKYVCYGVTVPVDASERLIDKTRLFQQLLGYVQARQDQAKQFRRCYQGLLAAYFGFDQHDATATSAGKNWQHLRGYLNDRLEPVARAARRRGRSPEWLEVLENHRNLLTDTPCERYAIALRAGDRSELEGVCAGLDISPTSWVWHEAVMAYVNEVVRSDHASFQAELSQVLVMVDGDRKQHQLPELVARNAVALCVARYAKCSDKPEHPALRDVCLRRIGNPWLTRPAWDASVKSEPARQMVESWLKRRLIKDFFELLAQDGAADLRRLTYWLKWEPQISDMWFVLGKSARWNRTTAFLELRERMTGRERVLTGATTDNNNAFVMRIGDQFVVEFGVTGNACFAFPASASGLDLESSRWDIYDLKHQPGHSKLSHSWSWEPKFDQELCALLRQAAPPKPPAPSPPMPESRPIQAAATGGVPASYAAPVRSREPSTVRPATPIALPSPPEQSAHDMPGEEPAPRPYWPSYTPLPETNTSSDPAGAAAQATAWPPNPVEIRPAQREALKYRCRRYGVTYEEATPNRPRSWVHLKNPASAPDVAQLAETIGFVFAPDVGFYADQPREADDADVPNTPSQVREAGLTAGAMAKATQGKQLDLLKKLCAVEGIGFEDNRPKGGAFWVRLIGGSASSSMVAMLNRMGFKPAPGKGYYLSGDD